MKRAIPLLLLLPLAACVTTSKFKAEESRFKAEQTRADKLDSSLAQAEKNLATQKAESAKTLEEAGLQIKTGFEQLSSVQKSNKDLQETLDAKKGELTGKISQLIKEKDSLSQKIADSAAETATLRKQKDAELDALKKAKDAELDVLRKSKDAELAAEQKHLFNLESALTGKDQELAARLRDLAASEQAKKALEEAKAAELAQVKKNYEDLTSGLKSEISAGEVTITQLKGKLTVNMVDRILFDSGLAEVRTAGRKVLDSIGKVLAEVADKDIRIEGHTDNKPIVGDLRNKYVTNWELSTSRATAVARYLQDQAKIDGKHLVAAGYGEFRPVASNDTPEHRAQNRRIEIVLVPRD